MQNIKTKFKINYNSVHYTLLPLMFFGRVSHIDFNLSCEMWRSTKDPAPGVSFEGTWKIGTSFNGPVGAWGRDIYHRYS